MSRSKEYRAKEKARYYDRTPIVPPRKWEYWEEQYLIENQNELAINVATYLGRTIRSIERRREILRKRGDLPKVE